MDPFRPLPPCMKPLPSSRTERAKLARASVGAQPLARTPEAFDPVDDNQRREQTIVAWLAFQRFCVQVGLLQEHDPIAALEDYAGAFTRFTREHHERTAATKFIRRGLGKRAIEQAHLLVMLNDGSWKHLLSLPHMDPYEIMEEEWTFLTEEVLAQRARSMPELKLLTQIRADYPMLGPGLAKRVADMGLAMNAMIYARDARLARANDIASLQDIGYEASLLGDQRTRLAAQRMQTVTEGTAKSQSQGSGASVESIFAALKRLAENPTPQQLTHHTDDPLDEDPTDHA